jgi:hypothetical protein
MKQVFVLTGVALLAVASPTFAKPSHGHGNSQGHGYNDAYGYGLGGCPHGLAKKHNGCMPPGQAKKLYRVGQRFPQAYGDRWSYNQIPYNLRNRYDLQPNDRYYYGNGYLYRVDPKTMLVEQVISALLRR